MKKIIKKKTTSPRSQKLSKINRKKKRGIIVSKKMPKTAIAEVEILKKHPYYHKRYRINSRIAVHDEKDEAKAGDRVEIEECRPISKSKRWKIIEIIK